MGLNSWFSYWLLTLKRFVGLPGCGMARCECRTSLRSHDTVDPSLCPQLKESVNENKIWINPLMTAASILESLTGSGACSTGSPRLAVTNRSQSTTNDQHCAAKHRATWSGAPPTGRVWILPGISLLLSLYNRAQTGVEKRFKGLNNFIAKQGKFW